MSHSARSPGQYPGGGVKQPPEFCTGSAISMPMVCGPSNSITSSISASSAAQNAASSPPCGWRYALVADT